MTADKDAFYLINSIEGRYAGSQARGSNKYSVAKYVKNARDTPDKSVLLPEYSLILLLAKPP
jgi:hypothetical protein